MAPDESDDLRDVCEAYLADQQRLLAVLRRGEDAVRVGVAMQARLDQLAAALRHARSYGIPQPRRSDPGS
jgi:hypothetical protein